MADGNDVDDTTMTFNVDGDHHEVDDDTFDALVQDSALDGDDDAALIQDFEAATADLVQSDPDLASAYTVYTEARRIDVAFLKNSDQEDSGRCQKESLVVLEKERKISQRPFVLTQVAAAKNYGIQVSHMWPRRSNNNNNNNNKNNLM